MKKLIKILLALALFIQVMFASKPGFHNQEMSIIPAGVYTPLYVDDTTDQSVKVESFLIDKYPVTNEQFLDFVKKNPRWKRSNITKLFADQNYLMHWESDEKLGQQVNPKSPVINISWFAAKAYAEFYGKRLPTVAEWELAAMADENNADGYKNDKYISRIISWYSKPNSESLPPVGSVFKNYYGVHDMHGLVWEWTGDFFNALVTGESRASNGINRNLFCGNGSVGATDFTNYPAFMRFAFRSSLKANYTTRNLGFRCAMDLK